MVSQHFFDLNFRGSEKQLIFINKLVAQELEVLEELKELLQKQTN